jgi:demethylmenaquinone methyltransferase/2-methoxy-6-polyprenyl-1,4-benzoquinol methylase
VDALIREQIEYYDARAPEYDRTSTPPGDFLAPFGRAQVEALGHFAPSGDVLEIASGTGSWTVELLRHASSVTALDASAGMIRIARAKVGDDTRVRFVRADVLSWRPDRRYDVVVFANWLSHLPRAAFDAFWAIVAEAVRPNGRVFFADELEDAWRNEALREEVVEEATSVVRRSLLDGRTFRVVKVFWDPAELRDRLAALGWFVEIHPIGPFFWAEAKRSKQSM